MVKVRLIIALVVFVLRVQYILAQPGEQGIDNRQLEVIFERIEKAQGVNPDSAILIATQALNKATEINDQELIVKAEYILGYSYYNRNDFELALNHLNRSLALAQDHSMSYWVAINFNRIGNVYQLKSNYNEALEFYKQALTINESLRDNHEIARTLVNLGTVNSLFGSYQRAIGYFLEALGKYESLQEPDGTAWTSLSIARLFNRLGLYEKALQYAEPALNQYRDIERRTGNATGVVLSLSELGGIYYHLGLFDKALELTRSVLEMNVKSKNLHAQAANRLLLGMIYFEKGDIPNAGLNLTRALEIKEQVNDSLDIAKLFRYLGDLHILKGDTRTGLGFLNKSLLFARNHNLLSDIKDSYQSLSRAYSAMGNYRVSLDYHILYSTLKDSINAGEIAKLEMQYDFDKREREQELITQQKEAFQRQRLERQRMLTIFTTIALLLAIALVLVILYFYREKQKTNRLLIAQNEEIRRQKSEIEDQKHEIESQRDLATRQRDQIADQQKQITDSIRYASRIQKAVMPREQSIGEYLSDYFILYKPKNIVSGDFYWVTRLNDGRTAVAVADCTGHGVPGAFMSMLGITLMKELGTTIGSESAGDVLFKLRRLVIASLNQTGIEGESVDGMDMSIVLIDKSTNVLEYAGAYLPILICRGSEAKPVENAHDALQLNGHCIYELKGNKMPIGFHVIGELPFTTLRVDLLPADTLYMFSDGYIDQFGNSPNLKFMLVNFKKLLLNIQAKSLSEQKQILDSTLEEFRGNHKQVDDILVMGFKV